MLLLVRGTANASVIRIGSHLRSLLCMRYDTHVLRSDRNRESSKRDRDREGGERSSSRREGRSDRGDREERSSRRHEDGMSTRHMIFGVYMSRGVSSMLTA